MRVSRLQHSTAEVESQDKLNLATVPNQLYSFTRHHLVKRQGPYSKIKSHSGARCSETNEQYWTNTMLSQFSL